MKKTISISLGGTLFNIEEDGYEKLNQYISQLKIYFQNYEGSAEIIVDIENRIAELLLQNKKEVTLPVTLEQVELIIATLGNINDFDAEPESASSADSSSTTNANADNFVDANQLKGKLTRNKASKYLGGVLSGLAVFMGIQAVWLRLIFLLFFFGFAWLPAIPGSLIIAYIILWIVMPEADLSKSITKERALLRSEKERVLGGVCAGLGLYLGIEITIIRLLFVISIFFFGTGILLYIILWMAMPKANSISDELKMKGKPITIESIEESFRSKNEDPNKEENRLAAVLLFPFRVIGVFFTKIAPVTKGITNILSVIFGLAFTLVGIIILAMAGVGIGVLYGYIPYKDFNFLSVSPVMQVIATFTDFDKAISSIASILPGILFFTLGLTMISLGKIKIRPIFLISIFFLWIISLLFVGIMVAKIESNYNVFEEVNTVEKYTPKSKSIQILYNVDSANSPWNEVELEISTWGGDYIKVDRYFKSKGKTAYEAQQSAKNISHSVTLQDSSLLIDRYFKINKNEVYAHQAVFCRVLIPKNLRLDALGELQYKFKDFQLNADELYKNSINFNFKNDTLFFLTDYFGKYRKGFAIKTTAPESEYDIYEEEASDNWLLIAINDSLTGQERLTIEGSKFMWHFNNKKVNQ